jgi:diacylglycerol O-acyltransferase
MPSPRTALATLTPSPGGEPSRPAPMRADAVLVPGTGPGMPVTLPDAGSLADRITRVAAITRQRKTPARATSVTLPGPLFRLLASTGLLRWFVSRQRLVHRFATNLRGPAQPLTLAGARYVR